MNIRILMCALAATIIVLIIDKTAPSEESIITFYELQLRGNFFSGLLTIGGFLLSLKTFIVIKLKENIYDHKEYCDQYEALKKLDTSLKKYAPLERLSNFLFWSVLATILAGISQLTIGLLGIYLLCLTAIWLSIFAMCVLVTSLFLMKSALNSYFSFINKQS